MNPSRNEGTRPEIPSLPTQEAIRNSSLPPLDRSLNTPIIPVRTFHQFCIALSLVHDQYVKEGLMEPHPSGMRFNKYLLHPNTIVFSAVNRGGSHGTMTFIPFSRELQIPAFKQFGSDLSPLIEAGNRIGEFTLFAVSESGQRGLHNPLRSELMRSAYHYANYYADLIAIVVHPIHAKLYKRAFGFEPKGQVISYDHANQAPGQLLLLEVTAPISEFQRRDNLLQREIRAKPVHPEIYARRFILNAQQAREMLWRCPEVALQLTNEERELFDTIYNHAVTEVLENL